MSLCMSQFQTLPSPPPWERTQAFDFFKNYIANSLLQGKNWWANSSPPGYVKRWQIPHAREHMSLIEFNKPVYTNQSLLKYIKKYIKLPSKMSTSFVRLFSTNQTFTNSSFSPLTHNSVYIECKGKPQGHIHTHNSLSNPKGFYSASIMSGPWEHRAIQMSRGGGHVWNWLVHYWRYFLHSDI